MGHQVVIHYPEAPSGTFTSSVPVFSDPDCVYVDPVRVLSAAGRRRFYIKQAPAVFTVSTAGGAMVETWTEGVRGELVEVYSPKLTGTLVNGTQGLGGYLSLLQAFERLAVSLGAEDFKVLETGQGTPQLIKDAFKSIRDANFPYYNVKDAPYNAQGDAATDDTAAIQAAITAAAAGGGGVVFLPAGVYITTSTISITNSLVILQGVGARSSSIRYLGAAGYAVSISVAGASGNQIADLGLTTNVAGGLALQVAGSPGAVVRRCYIGPQSGSISCPGAVTANCRLTMEANIVGYDCSTNDRGLIEITDSGAGSGSLFDGNTFTGTFGITGRSAIRITAGSLGSYRYIGNSITDTGYGIIVAVASTMSNHAVVGNALGSNGVVLYLTAAAAGNAGYISVSGNVTRNNVDTAGSVDIIAFGMEVAVDQASESYASGTTFTPSAGKGDHAQDVTGTPVTANAPTAAPAWNGLKTQFRLRNTTGAPAVINWNAIYLGSAAMGNLAANTTRVVRWTYRSTAPAGWRYAGHWDTA